MAKSEVSLKEQLIIENTIQNYGLLKEDIDLLSNTETDESVIVFLVPKNDFMFGVKSQYRNDNGLVIREIPKNVKNFPLEQGKYCF